MAVDYWGLGLILNIKILFNSTHDLVISYCMSRCVTDREETASQGCFNKLCYIH